MKVKVDVDTCISCELCPQICPEVFEMGEDGKAHEKMQDVPADQEAAAREAAESCPVSAILVED